MDGFTSREDMGILNNMSGIDFVGYDDAEVCPPYDPSGITGFFAASVVHTFMALIARQKLEKEKKQQG